MNDLNKLIDFLELLAKACFTEEAAKPYKDWAAALSALIREQQPKPVEADADILKRCDNIINQLSDRPLENNGRELLALATFIRSRLLQPNEWHGADSHAADGFQQPERRDTDSVTHLYEWLAPKLSTQERNALDAIYAAVKHHERSEQVQLTANRDVLAICVAYESGYGKGMDFSDDENPYRHGSDEHQAYDTGYHEGLEKNEQQREFFRSMILGPTSAIMERHYLAQPTPPEKEQVQGVGEFLIVPTQERAPSLPEGLVHIGQLEEIPHGDDDGGLIIAVWNHEKYELPPGTKLYAARPTPAQEETK